MQHIKRILVANRGEIACRIMRTAHKLGLRTIAIYAEPDAQAPHVRMADEAWPIEGPSPTGAYLNMDAILEVAEKAGAHAIHPGYGFLSENADFARRVIKAGIRFVGPRPDAIEQMGDKSTAKAAMEAAGVPTVPGYHGEDQSPDRLLEEARRIGFPVLIKASAGGGGKGMKVAESVADFPDALESAQREALNAFGSNHVLLEKYLPVARHVEVQLLCDAHGHALYIGDRDCSVQRRHQKILEEAPAPGLSDALRAAMGEAAVRCARAIGYVNAGTVEFLLGPDDAFYFMEVNTRLQVEHPVTECVSGLDLVEWQLRIADDQPLPFTQDDVQLQGHAIEARIYAEQPAKAFLPSTGRLTQVVWPETSAGLRVDHAVESGTEVSAWFDPMLAKMIVHAPSRDAAINRLFEALCHTRIEGVQTNLDYLCHLLATDTFREARLHTRLCEEHPPGKQRLQEAVLPHAVAALLQEGRLQIPRPLRQWAWSSNTPIYETCFTLSAGDEHFHLNARLEGDTVSLRWRDAQHCFQIRWSETSGKVSVRAAQENVWRNVSYVYTEHTLILTEPELAIVSHQHQTSWEADSTAPENDTLAPMSGTVIKVLKSTGDTVEAGDTIMILEAMKMEHPVRASHEGILEKLFVSEGNTIREGQSLFTYASGKDGKEKDDD
ncbi:MAG: ATP-grasp domain-containing protein [Gammaproteobacteria bacterium]|nr:MAG: ATP-grasp domain-containing protein [Gammaproteobacteria bacterium]